MSPAALRAKGLDMPEPLGLDPLPDLHVTLSDRPAQAMPFGLPAPGPAPRAEPVAPILLDEEARLTELDEPFLEEDPDAEKQAASGKTEDNQRKKAAGSTRPRPNSIEGALAGVGGPEYLRVASSLLPEAGAGQAASFRAGQGMGAVSLLAPMMATAQDMAALAPDQEWMGGQGASWSADALNGAARRAPLGSGGPGPDAMEFHVNFPLSAQSAFDGVSGQVALQVDRNTAGPHAPVLPHVEAPGAAPKAQPRPAPEPEGTDWRPHLQAEAFEQPRGSAVEPAGGLPEILPRPGPSPEPTSGGHPRDAAPPSIALPVPVPSVSHPGQGDAGPARPMAAPLPWLEPTVQAATPPGKALGAGNGKGADPIPMLPIVAIVLPDAVSPPHKGAGHRAEAAADRAEVRPGRAHENQMAKEAADQTPISVSLPGLEVGLFVPPGHAKHDRPEPSKGGGPLVLEAKQPPGLAEDGPGKPHDKPVVEKVLAFPAALATPLAVEDLPGKGQDKHDKQAEKALPLAATLDPLLPEVAGSGPAGKGIGQQSEKAPAHTPAALEAARPGKAHGKPTETPHPGEAAPSGKPQEVSGEKGADLPGVSPHTIHLKPGPAETGKGKGQAAKDDAPPASLPQAADDGPGQAHGKPQAKDSEPMLTLVLPEIPGGAATNVDLGSKGKADKQADLGIVLAGGGSKSQAALHGPNSGEQALDMLASEPHPAGKPHHGPPFATAEMGFDASHPSHHPGSDWHL
ncbi:hypothetical protein [Sabulicella glaciei]|uniref:Uncharacterized protein n=1 Tax=Sabulicella glaciei TaxID=2984948 RepID=A0ABT3NT78_9PROT|nr:hypothetical protein [Roseococcus sp. MDT2-1-1]MCW8085354.1 hypothetical protein [Roseococcus sp. MDT2-1-1]